MGRFKGTDYSGDFIDNQQIYGNIFKLLMEADHFLRRHLPIASFFHADSFERIDEPALPVLAVREAMVNAVCHRDYSNRAGSITLEIFDDHLEIWSHGTLPSDLKLSDLKEKHKSYPRNKMIANVLYSRKFFERWGSGTIKIINLCKAQGVPEPEFNEYSGGFSVIFRFKEPISLPIKKTIKKIKLSTRQEEILKSIKKHGAMNIHDIMNTLVEPPSQRMIRKDLDGIRKVGLIELKGHGRSALWTLCSNVNDQIDMRNNEEQ